MSLETHLRSHRSLYSYLTFLGSLAVLIYLWQLHPEIMFFVTAAYALLALRWFFRFEIERPVIVGLLIAVSYLTFFKDLYVYNTLKLEILSYPLFPLVAWPFGLTMLYHLVEYGADALGVRSTLAKILTGYLLYVPFLVSLEYYGYHYSNMQLESQYPGLPFIDCMHIPTTLKIVYFANGLVFLIILFSIRTVQKRPGPARRGSEGHSWNTAVPAPAAAATTLRNRRPSDSLLLDRDDT